MTTEICKNCGGWRGLHKWDTMQCPYMGEENNNWQATTYEEADETAAARITELERQVKKLEATTQALLKTAKHALEFLESIIDYEGSWVIKGLRQKISDTESVLNDKH